MHLSYHTLLFPLIKISLVWSHKIAEPNDTTADSRLKIAITNHKLTFAKNISISNILTAPKENSSVESSNVTVTVNPDYTSPVDAMCDPAVASFNCGTLEYLGCTGKKQFFHESTVKVTWFEAWEYCLSYGMHLAAIESRYEHFLLETFLEKPQTSLVETYWTSGNRFSGSFTWMATGKLITYVNWRTGEPNNRFGNEHCVELVTMSNLDNFRWNDRVCNSLAYALCQKEIH